MATLSLEQQILEQVSRLDIEERRKVLEYARQLARAKPAEAIMPPGISGAELIALADSLDFDLDDLREMELAIDEGCGNVDDNWDRIDLDEVWS
jgi:hypothetical protein